MCECEENEKWYLHIIKYIKQPLRMWATISIEFRKSDIMKYLIRISIIYKIIRGTQKVDKINIHKPFELKCRIKRQHNSVSIYVKRILKSLQTTWDKDCWWSKARVIQSITKKKTLYILYNKSRYFIIKWNDVLDHAILTHSFPYNRIHFFGKPHNYVCFLFFPFLNTFLP